MLPSVIQLHSKCFLLFPAAWSSVIVSACGVMGREIESRQGRVFERKKKMCLVQGDQMSV
jgi:hypothetical protein